MTIEEIKTAELETIEARAAEIANEVETADAETVEALDAELSEIEARKAVIKEERDRQREAMEEVAKGAGETVEEVKEDRKTMENIEIRNTPEYLDAWVASLKGNASEEQRALLTDNTSGGMIPVPTYVDEIIHTAWENNEIFRRIKKTYYPGNLKVAYEISAPIADYHTEGGNEMDPENLQLGIIEMVPAMLKKWVPISDEALEVMASDLVAQYVVDEITDRIIKGLIDSVIGAAASSTLAASYTAAGAALATADVIGAQGLLSGEASAPVLITSRAAAAAMKAAALSGSYGYDPFDGLDVLYVDADMLTNANALGFVADLSGIQANFPNGDDVKIKFDDSTLATSDMVRVIGRLYVAVNVVAPGKVVKIVTA